MHTIIMHTIIITIICKSTLWNKNLIITTRIAIYATIVNIVYTAIYTTIDMRDLL